MLVIKYSWIRELQRVMFFVEVQKFQKLFFLFYLGSLRLKQWCVCFFKMNGEHFNVKLACEMFLHYVNITNYIPLVTGIHCYLIFIRWWWVGSGRVSSFIRLISGLFQYFPEFYSSCLLFFAWACEVRSRLCVSFEIPSCLWYSLTDPVFANWVLFIWKSVNPFLKN